MRRSVSIWCTLQHPVYAWSKIIFNISFDEICRQCIETVWGKTAVHLLCAITYTARKRPQILANNFQKALILHNVFLFKNDPALLSFSVSETGPFVEKQGSVFLNFWGKGPYIKGSLWCGNGFCSKEYGNKSISQYCLPPLSLNIRSVLLGWWAWLVASLVPSEFWKIKFEVLLTLDVLTEWRCLCVF